MTATGCGTSDAPRKTISNHSVHVASQPIIRDITALGKAAAVGRTNEPMLAIYDLLATAQSLPNDREGWKGLALIRTLLPGILVRYLAAYPRIRTRLDRVPMETATGDALRAWLLAAYESQRRELIQLRNEVANGGYAWAAVLRWSEGNHAASARSSIRLSSILRSIPVAQQPAANLAITEDLG
jgi:hypothetical protein